MACDYHMRSHRFSITPFPTTHNRMQATTGRECAYLQLCPQFLKICLATQEIPMERLSI